MSDVLDAVMTAAPVIPVLVVEEVAHAAPLARALVAGGLTSLEVTLRTPTALDVVAAMVAAVPEARIGVGTVLSGMDLDAARAAGAVFAVSPGGSPRLLDAAEGHPLPLLPGAATATEVMALLERGYTRQKFFPAAAAGGPALLNAIGGPLPQVRFCPTGGIGASAARAWLQLPNVACVGGSWVAPKDLVERGEWARITALASVAAGLRAADPPE